MRGCGCGSAASVFARDAATTTTTTTSLARRSAKTPPPAAAAAVPQQETYRQRLLQVAVESGDERRLLLLPRRRGVFFGLQRRGDRGVRVRVHSLAFLGDRRLLGVYLSETIVFFLSNVGLPLFHFSTSTNHQLQRRSDEITQVQLIKVASSVQLLSRGGYAAAAAHAHRSQAGRQGGGAWFWGVWGKAVRIVRSSETAG